MREVVDFRTLLEALGSAQKVAAHLGRTSPALSNMKKRNSVSPALWDHLVELAVKAGLSEVTKDLLHGWYVQRDSRTPSRITSSGVGPAAADDASSVRERAA